MAVIVPRAESIQEGWPYEVRAGWEPELVQQYCVQDSEWQKVRLSMKGKPTHIKLEILYDWREKQMLKAVPSFDSAWHDVERRLNCQIDNYLGALRRGGQLDMDNCIKKYI